MENLRVDKEGFSFSFLLIFSLYIIYIAGFIAGSMEQRQQSSFKPITKEMVHSL